jgi:hypothetical protein
MLLYQNNHFNSQKYSFLLLQKTRHCGCITALTIKNYIFLKEGV